MLLIVLLTKPKVTKFFSQNSNVCDFLAIRTLKSYPGAVYDGFESRRDVLVIGHAHGVDAPDYPGDGLGDGEHLLLHHLEVPDDVHAGVGCYEGYLVELVILEESFGYLDDALA